MTRKEIIEFLKSKKVEFNPTLRLADLEALYKQHSDSVKNPSSTSVPMAAIGDSESDMSRVLSMMGTLVNKVDSLDKRVARVEGPTGKEFMLGAKAPDVEKASESKKNIDEKIVKIVEEVLGVDFGIELDTYPDRPGYLFTVIVPERLSDIPPATRPVIDPDTGKYKVQADLKTVVLEDYKPEDRRSRNIGSTQSYDAIREHCNKVRSYIVSYYTKLSKPAPEFKLKTN